MPRFLVVLLVLFLAPAVHADTRPFDVEDLVRLDRVGDPQVSPDGRRIAYTLRETDMDGNRGVVGIWMVPADGSRAPRRMTGPGASAVSPRWAPDGNSIYFLTSRSGSMQVWNLPLVGGEAMQVTDYPIGVGAFVVASGGKRLALSFEVFLDCEDLDCSKARLDERAKAKTTGVLHESLFVRHWDSWKDGRRAQLFIADIGEDGRAGTPRHLSRGMDADIPSKPFGGADEIAFSPDGAHIVFAARVEGAAEPWSTNLDLYRVATAGEAAPENITADNPATDTSPVFSPDGRHLAWLAMSRAGFEADRYRILLRDLRSGDTREVAPDWDRSAHGLAFSRDGRTLFTWSDDVGHRRLFAIDVRSGAATAISGDGSIGGFSVGGDTVAFSRDHLGGPAQIHRSDLRGRNLRQLTEHNAERLAGVAFGEYEQFSFEGADDVTVYGWVVKPVGFQEGTTYPVAFIVHGGPQGSMGNSFHYRWNPQTYAGQGYAVVFIDFHGSTGYGQAFTDAISGDWGGRPLIDLKKGWAAAQQKYPFLDGGRACALGASYGGWMINWMAGQWPDGFVCMVNHCGVMDNRSMYYTTEELWFVEWEFGGPQFENPEGYEKQNPLNHVDQWQTPMLVVHGANDFRVPLGQGLAAFTALQRRGIPSQLLYFPDENHWVLKPHNSIQWHRTVEAWLKRWTAAE
jgi:dipeptidyl aminopeptidase/acylaminoacyl peptidase